MTTIKIINEGKMANRIAEDSVGATVGAATGVGISALAGLVMPGLTAIVPWGLVVGSIIGILVQEIAQQKHENGQNSQKQKS